MGIRFSQVQIEDRLRLENIWWNTYKIDEFYAPMKRREYFQLFLPLVQVKEVKRAVVLMGPRRVGKTVMLFHTIQSLIEQGADPLDIAYFSIETPIYNGISLEELLHLFLALRDKPKTDDVYIFFDEIQYLKDWEIHLKSLVDTYHNIKFIVSGSAAAALRLKSNESGAGRFTDFSLPPLTFHEYLSLKGLDDFIIQNPAIDKDGFQNLNYDAFETADIDTLNAHFVEYINFGGYPEVSLSETMRLDPGRYIRSDIIDKVLLRDLPSLYGIQDVQELNSLFTYLAYNSGGEMSLEGIAQNSGVAKNTIKRYISYLEAAFLIKIIDRVDNNAKRFKRANYFKVYLTNPSLRSALFGPIDRRDDAFGQMVETAIFSQWQHSNVQLYYARWPGGEVDIVYLGPRQKPLWCVEIKWSNRFAENPSDLRPLKTFCSRNGLTRAMVTTIDIQKSHKHEGVVYDFVPASINCYEVGRQLVEGRRPWIMN